ncbi:hypothetical protein ACJZ2D_006292 [Fusarium nematophilum]
MKILLPCLNYFMGFTLMGGEIEFPETAFVHFDCLKCFSLGYTGKGVAEGIWNCVFSKKPWSFATDPAFDAKPIDIPGSRVAELIGFPQLASLPPEIVLEIRNLSSESDFWSYCDVLAAADQASKLPPRNLSSFPITHILQWEQGKVPVVDTNSSNLPIVHVTFDTQGISRIERLAEMPVEKRGKTRNQLHLFLDDSLFNDIIVYFMHGFARLKFGPLPGRHFCTWDTPTPPTQGQSVLCLHADRFKSRYPNLQTIDLSKVTGLTFLLFDQKIVGIHAHTESEPTASMTAAQCHFGGKADWMYFPIASGDEVLAFGIRGWKHEIPEWRKARWQHEATNTCFFFLFSTKLAGHVGFGFIYQRDFEDENDSGEIILSASQPKTLLYSVSPAKSGRFNYLGVEAQGNEVRWPACALKSPQFIGSGTPYYSSAPLQDVYRVTIFYSHELGHVKGFLLEYKNGGQRALGQCRLQVDRAEAVLMPQRICFLNPEDEDSEYEDSDDVESDSSLLHFNFESGYHYGSSDLMVECNTEIAHGHEQDGWQCVGLTGYLEFWFQDHRCLLRHTTE